MLNRALSKMASSSQQSRNVVINGVTMWLFWITCNILWLNSYFWWVFVNKSSFCCNVENIAHPYLKNSYIRFLFCCGLFTFLCTPKYTFYTKKKAYENIFIEKRRKISCHWYQICLRNSLWDAQQSCRLRRQRLKLDSDPQTSPWLTVALLLLPWSSSLIMNL